MFFSSSRSVRIDKQLYEGLAALAQREGYASPDELIRHVLEQKVAGMVDDLDAKQAEQQLRGLGYLE
ncbi:MAG: ribbon-helix-helix protein, CopG family [Pirellulales bacterium]|nr:ribbon-helix-helix protein, CopG family [Pirellulales bacterium]